MATRAAATVVRRRHRVVWAALGLAFASFADGGKKRRTPPEPPDLLARQAEETLGRMQEVVAVNKAAH